MKRLDISFSAAALPLIVAFLANLTVPAAAPAISLEQLKAVTLDVFNAHNEMSRADKTQLRVIKIKADSMRASGYAAITWSGTSATIFVDPNMLRIKGANTWAFVIGHEISHYILGHDSRCRPPSSQVCKQREFAADSAGAMIGRAAGYDLVDYISDMLASKNYCSLSHGCWHQRALRLAIESGLAVNRDEVPDCNARGK